MRPTQTQIIRSLRHSLDTHVIPHLDGDPWATYEAKTMRRVLEHLERRVAGEATSVRDDVDDLRSLVGQVHPRLVEAGVGVPAAPPLTDDPVQSQQALRRHYVELVGALDAAEADGAVTPDAAAPARALLHDHARRQIARDAWLAEPAFMSFAPPPGSGSR